MFGLKTGRVLATVLQGNGMADLLAPGIYTISRFLTPVECDGLVQLTEAGGFEAATINTIDGPVVDATVRDNRRHVRDDRPLADLLWQRTGDHIPRFLNGCQAIGLNERFRIYRYDPGQRFAWHADAPYRRENGEHSLLTLIIYLNEGFAGGETAFSELVVPAERGMALIFRHELPHEGRPVANGRKYVLRSDVMFNPIGRVSG